MRVGATLAIILFLAPINAWSAMPEWAKSATQQRSGAILKVVCSGSGPSMDVAKHEAIQSCQSSASHELSTSIEVKSLSIETERSVGFHQEVSESKAVSGLRCQIDREETEELNGAFRTYLLCRFDLSKAHSKPTKLNPPPTHNKRTDLSEVRERKLPEQRAPRVNQRRVISFASIPPCESILIRGEKPRVVECKENPTSVVVEAGDHEVIIRASGYQTKSMTLEGGDIHEAVQVILDPL